MSEGDVDDTEQELSEDQEIEKAMKEMEKELE